MPQELRLILTLEHLPTHDVTVNGERYWTFGFVLSAGTAMSLAVDRRNLLRPWLWNFSETGSPSGLIYRIDINGAPGQVSTDLAAFVPPLFHNCPLSDFASVGRNAIAALNYEFERIAADDEAALKWEPANGERRVNASVQSGIATPDGNMRRPWHTILAQSSRYAAPIPQLLKLSHIFRVRVPTVPTGATVSILAAPIIQASGTTTPPSDPIFPQLTRPENTGPLEWPNHGGIQRWEYDQPAIDAIPVVAYLMPARIRERRPTTTTLFDFGSLWVNSPNESSDTEDWRATLEQKMADALDLGARVLEASRPRITGGPNDRPDVGFRPTHQNRVAIEQMVLASLRDLAGIGYREAPGGRCLINMALATYTDLADRQPLVEPFGADPQPNRRLIEQRLNDVFGGDNSLEEWKKLLRETVEELAGSSVLAENAQVIAGREAIEDETAFERALNELEHVRLAVFRPANLEKLIRAQWKLIAPNPGPLPRLAALALRTEFPTLDPRSALARENLWSMWREFLRLIQPTAQDLTGRTSVEENFPRLFESYFNARFRGAIPPGADCSNGNLPLPGVRREPRVPRQIPPLVVTAVCQEIAFFSRDAARNLVARNPERAVEPTDVPHAITIQVDSLGGLPTTGEDLLDEVSGVGILMREKPANQNDGRGWKCLNIASPRFRDVSATPRDDRPAERVLTIVPARLVYTNDLRFGSVTYNNHPLTAGSPVGELSNVKLKAPKTDALRSSVAAEAQRDNVQPIVDYVYPSPNLPGCGAGTTSTRFLPGLKFGSSYEVLPFLITNSGCLPRELAPMLPYDAQLDQFDSQNRNISRIVSGKIRRFDYLRKVRVGELRVLSPETDDRIRYPAIPETVSLRLRDLDLAGLLPEGTPESEQRKEHPVLLLRPQSGPWSNDVRPDFSFHLRIPGTDLNTWDRWVARDEVNRPLRKNVWAAYYYELDLKAPRESTQETQDVSLDDPAVSEFLYLELAEFDGAGGVQTRQRWARYRNPVADPRNTLAEFHRRPLPVTCTVDETFNIDGPPNFESVTVHMRKGRLYRLTAWSCVPVADRRRFDRIFPSTMPTNVQTPGGTEVFRVSPITMFYEVATDELLADDEKPRRDADVRQVLYDALSPSFSLEGEQPLRVRLLPAGATDPATAQPRLFRFIQRVELSRQVWRWQGRQTHPHPRTIQREPVARTDRNYARAIRQWEASSQFIDAVEQWEEREFGNRSELDKVVIDMETATDLRNGRRSFEYVEKFAEQTGTNSQDPVAARDLRALHYRFSIQVFSRYASIMTGGGSEQSARLDGAFDPATRPRTFWKPLFVPCRVTSLNDPPKLKFILPLTESFGQSRNGSAGALVVFDEPWHEIGGLGETIIAEVATIEDPANSSIQAFEAGPDPLVSSVDRALLAGSDVVVVPPRDLKGPIGHTFDTAGDAPFFNATSFIVPAPTATRVDGSAGVTPAYQVPWSFAKMRFKRRIEKGIRSDNTPDRVDSNFTDSFWIQFIPEFSVLNASNLKPSELRVRRERDPRTVTIVNTRNVPVSLPPSNGIFERYLVLTQRITDVRGEKNHEAYVAVFKRTDTATWEILDTSAQVRRQIPPTQLKLRARIMEVQRHPTLASAINFEPELWNSLFGEEIQDRHRLRIVAVSHPIEDQEMQNESQ